MTTKAQIEAVERLVRESVAHVDQMAPEAMRAVLPALRTARDELRQDLAEWMRTVDNGANRFTAYEKTKALRSLESAISRVEQLHPAMSHALGLGRSSVGGIAVANLETEIVRLGHIFGDAALSMPQIDTAAVIAQGNRLLWKRHEKSAIRYAGNVGEDIKNLFAVGVAKHETFEQLVTRLRRIGGGRGVGISPDAPDEIAGGLFHRYKYRADRLVRTEMMHAYNVQHSDAIERVNELRPEGEEEYLRKWDASVDSAICPLCRALDKTVTTINGEFPGGVKSPPLHPHCRCVVLAWLRRWGDMKGEVGTVGHVPETPKKEAAPEPPRSQARESDQEATQPKKNPKRVEAAKKAAEASAERRREIHSAVKSNLSQDLQVAWDQEGHKFMREEAARIRGVKDRVNAASKLSEAFSEKYGSGDQTAFGNEGDRFQRRAEIEAKHAAKWAEEQEAKYYEAAYREALRNGEIDETGELIEEPSEPVGRPPRKSKASDDDPPF